MADIERRSSAVWNGDLRGGNGTFSSHSGVLADIPYSYATRFEQAEGTNPEESDRRGTRRVLQHGFERPDRAGRRQAGAYSDRSNVRFDAAAAERLQDYQDPSAHTGQRSRHGGRGISRSAEHGKKELPGLASAGSDRDRGRGNAGLKLKPTQHNSRPSGGCCALRRRIRYASSSIEHDVYWPTARKIGTRRTL